MFPCKPARQSADGGGSSRLSVFCIFGLPSCLGLSKLPPHKPSEATSPARSLREQGLCIPVCTDLVAIQPATHHPVLDRVRAQLYVFHAPRAAPLAHGLGAWESIKSTGVTLTPRSQVLRQDQRAHGVGADGIQPALGT